MTTPRRRHCAVCGLIASESKVSGRIVCATDDLDHEIARHSGPLPLWSSKLILPGQTTPRGDAPATTLPPAPEAPFSYRLPVLEHRDSCAGSVLRASENMFERDAIRYRCLNCGAAATVAKDDR